MINAKPETSGNTSKTPSFFPKEVVLSSVKELKDSNLLSKTLFISDFIMQTIAPWPMYLSYTAIRCATLAYEYSQAEEENKHLICRKSALYANTKVLGLLVVQISLIALQLTNPVSVAVILSWGAVLFGFASFAHYSATRNELELGCVDNSSRNEGKFI